MEKVVYWRNLSNPPFNGFNENEIDIPKEKIEYQKPKRYKARKKLNFDNILFYSKVALLILIVLLTIGIIEYIRRFDLTKAFILASIYLSVFISVTIYMIRFALFGELLSFNVPKRKQKFQQLEFAESIPKKVINTTISIKPEDIESNEENEMDEKLKLKKHLKSKGNVFAFKEDVKLTQAERERRDENNKLWESYLYTNNPTDETTQLHGEGYEKVYL